MEHNAACLMTFVDVLVDLACEQRRTEREITELGLRGDLMKKEGIVVKNYWEKLSGKQLFKCVWNSKNIDERKAAKQYAATSLGVTSSRAPSTIILPYQTK